MSQGAAQVSAEPLDDATTGAGERALQAYRQEKLELAECLLSLMHVAEARHDDAGAAQIREVAALLAEDRFQLAVVGQFSRGKSTLMNAVLGAAYLPTGALPMTSVITTVVYGSRTRATIGRGLGLMPIEVALDELVRYVAQTSPEREELRAKSVLVELPAEILRLGFSFVDTPGVGSAITANTETTLGFSSQADAVVFVTSFDSALTEAEVSFLRSVHHEVRRIFVVINKPDLVDDTEANQVEAFVAARLQETGVEGARIFQVSARDGLAAKSSGDPAGLVASGILALESELVDYLTTEKAREFLLRVTERADRLVASLSGEAQLAAKLAADDGSRARAGQFVNELASRLDVERHRLLDVLAASASDQLARLSGDVATQWADALFALVSGEVAALAGFPGRTVHLVAAAHDLEARTTGPVTAWAERAGARWIAALEKECRPPLVDLSHLPVALETEAARYFGTIPAASQASEDARLPHPPPARSVWAVPPPRWKTVWSRARAIALLRDALKSAAESHAQRLVESTRGSVGCWLAALGMWSESELRAAAGRARAPLAMPADARLGSELSALAATVAESRSRIESWSIGARRDLPLLRLQNPRSEPAGKASGCVVCARLVRALFDFMAHYQFELATRTERRAAHVSAKGFCRPHTWYYAEIGSPVGVSAAYARLGEAGASALSDAAGNVSDISALRAALTASHASRADCQACARLAAVLQEVLGELRAGLGQPAPYPVVPAVCIGHAGDLLAGELDMAVARQVVSNTADRLRRRSEDMRTYSLKRESLRRALVDREEESAYLDVLVWLAGDPLLAGAPRGETQFSSPRKGSAIRT